VDINSPLRFRKLLKTFLSVWWPRRRWRWTGAFKYTYLLTERDRLLLTSYTISSTIWANFMMENVHLKCLSLKWTCAACYISVRHSVLSSYTVWLITRWRKSRRLLSGTRRQSQFMWKEITMYCLCQDSHRSSKFFMYFLKFFEAWKVLENKQGPVRTWTLECVVSICASYIAGLSKCLRVCLLWHRGCCGFHVNMWF